MPVPAKPPDVSVPPPLRIDGVELSPAEPALPSAHWLEHGGRRVADDTWVTVLRHGGPAARGCRRRTWGATSAPHGAGALVQYVGLAADAPYVSLASAPPSAPTLIGRLRTGRPLDEDVALEMVLALAAQLEDAHNRGWTHGTIDATSVRLPRSADGTGADLEHPVLTGWNATLQRLCVPPTLSGSREDSCAADARDLAVLLVAVIAGKELDLSAARAALGQQPAISRPTATVLLAALKGGVPHASSLRAALTLAREACFDVASSRDAAADRVSELLQRPWPLPSPAGSAAAVDAAPAIRETAARNAAGPATTGQVIIVKPSPDGGAQVVRLRPDTDPRATYERGYPADWSAIHAFVRARAGVDAPGGVTNPPFTDYTFARQVRSGPHSMTIRLRSIATGAFVVARIARSEAGGDATAARAAWKLETQWARTLRDAPAVSADVAPVVQAPDPEHPGYVILGDASAALVGRAQGAAAGRWDLERAVRFGVRVARAIVALQTRGVLSPAIGLDTIQVRDGDRPWLCEPTAPTPEGFVAPEVAALEAGAAITVTRSQAGPASVFAVSGLVSTLVCGTRELLLRDGGRATSLRTILGAPKTLHVGALDQLLLEHVTEAGRAAHWRTYAWEVLRAGLKDRPDDRGFETLGAWIAAWEELPVPSLRA